MIFLDCEIEPINSGFIRLGQFATLFVLLLGSFSNVSAETFKFKSKTGLTTYSATIGGDLSFPGGLGPFPLVILLHPCGGLDSSAKTSLSAKAHLLAMAGFGTHILDSFSARGLTANDICDAPKFKEASEFRLDDVFNARDALQKHPKVDKGQFFLVGQSQGATVALWAAVNLTGREPFRAVAAYYPSCTALQHGFALKSATMVFAGGKDDWTPAQICEQTKKRERSPGREYELVLYPSAYHGFDQRRPRPFTYKGHIMAYDEQAAAESNSRMKDFFVRFLRD